MKELLIYPIFAVVFLGFAMQLIDIAESTTTKTIDYAEDMSRAVDCAVRGIDLSVCSPNLMDHDFEPEINRTIKTNKEIISKMQEILNKEIQDISEEDSAVIVQLKSLSE